MKTTLPFIIAGVLLVIAIVMAALVKPFVNNFEKYGKKPFFTGLAIAVCASLAGTLIIFIFKDQPFTIYWVLTVTLLTFGVIQLLLTHTRFFLNYDISRYRTLAGEFFFTAAVALLSVFLLMAIILFVLKYTGFLFFTGTVSLYFFFYTDSFFDYLL